MIKLWLFHWQQFEQVTLGHHDILLLIQWDDALQRPLWFANHDPLPYGTSKGVSIQPWVASCRQVMIKLWLFQWQQFEQVTQGHHDIMLLIQWDDALQRPLCLPIMTHRRNRHPKAFLLSHGSLLADK
jgi:alpha-N-acetylglucosamine transferase